MPSIVGRKTRSLAADSGYNKSTDVGYGGSGPSSRNYPSSSAYQQALQDYGSSLNEDIRARVSPATGRPSTVPSGSSIPGSSRSTQTAVPGRGPFFDIPSDNLPTIPYGRMAGRMFAMLASRAPYPPLRIAGLLAQLALALPPESFDRSIKTWLSGGPDYALGSQTRPGYRLDPNNGGWHTRLHCANCYQTGSNQIHLYEHRNLSPGCYKNQYWSCVYDPPGRVLGPGQSTTDCYIWAHWTGNFCNGCNDHIWIRSNPAPACDGQPRVWPGRFQYMRVQQTRGLPQGIQLGPNQGVETAAPQPWPHDLVPRRANDRDSGHEVGPRTRTRTRTRTRLKPWQEPARQTAVSVRGGGRKPPRVSRVTRTQEPHLRRPASRRERERKYKVGGPLAQVLMRGIGHLTEGLDLVNAIYWALPEDVRLPGATQIDRGEVVLWWFQNATDDQWDEVGPAILFAIVVMELQDTLIGKSARHRGEVYAEVGRQMGLPDATSWAGKLAKKVDDLLETVH